MSKKSTPFLGIMAVGSTLPEAVKAYRDVAKGKSAIPITDGQASFLLVSNASTQSVFLTNPLTGQLDVREVPQALSGISFQTKPTDATKAHYNICASTNEDGSRGGCGAHIISDYDTYQFCPVCNDTMSGKMTDSEIANLLSYDELGGLILQEEADAASQKAVAGDDSSDDSSADDDNSDDYEELSINDILDDDDSDDAGEDAGDASTTDDDYDAYASSLFSADDDTLLTRTGKTGIKATSAESADHDGADVFTPEELNSIRNDLLREAQRELVATSGEFSAKLKALVAYGKTQNEAMDKYNAIQDGKATIGVVASSRTNQGFITTASDIDEFKHNPQNGRMLNGSMILAGDKATKALSGVAFSMEASGSSMESVITADMKKCSDADCGIYIVSSSSDSSNCPLCASSLVEPDSIEVPGIVDTGVADQQASVPAVTPQQAAAIADLNAYRAHKDQAQAKAPETATIDNVDQNKAVASDESDVLVDLMYEALSQDTSPDAYKKLSVVYCGSLDSPMRSESSDEVSYVKQDHWVAFYANDPIARATSASCVQYKDIFYTPAFATAVVASAKVNGPKKALTDMGFKPIKAKVRVAANVTDLVNKAVSDASLQAKASADSERGEYEDRFMSAMASAAEGINNGFFRNMANPVKAALVSSLTAAGVRNPEVLIDNVFRTQATAYNRMLLQKAKEIVSKPLDVQNELSMAIMDTAYQSTSGANSSPQTTEDRLASFGSSVEQKDVAGMTSTSSNAADSGSNNGVDMNKINKTVATLGRMSFGR